MHVALCVKKKKKLHRQTVGNNLENDLKTDLANGEINHMMF